MYRNVYFTTDTTTDDYRFGLFYSLSTVSPQTVANESGALYSYRTPLSLIIYTSPFKIFHLQNALSTAPRSSIPTSTSIPASVAPSGALSHQPHSAGRSLHSGRNDDVAPRSRSRSRLCHQAHPDPGPGRAIRHEPPVPLPEVLPVL